MIITDRTGEIPPVLSLLGSIPLFAALFSDSPVLHFLHRERRVLLSHDGGILA